MAVYVLLHDGYADWELGYLLPELIAPPVTPDIPKKNYPVVTFGLDDQPVRSMGGLRVVPDITLDTVERGNVDALVLPGGTFWPELVHPPLDELVRSLVAEKCWVAGVCAATGYLARLGLLDDTPHASNSLGFLEEFAPTYQGGAHLQPTLATTSRPLITASGLGAIDFTKEILGALAVYPPPVLEIWYRAHKHGENPFADRTDA